MQAAQNNLSKLTEFTTENLVFQDAPQEDQQKSLDPPNFGNNLDPDLSALENIEAKPSSEEQNPLLLSGNSDQKADSPVEANFEQTNCLTAQETQELLQEAKIARQKMTEAKVKRTKYESGSKMQLRCVGYEENPSWEVILKEILANALRAKQLLAKSSPQKKTSKENQSPSNLTESRSPQNLPASDMNQPYHNKTKPLSSIGESIQLSGDFAAQNQIQSRSENSHQTPTVRQDTPQSYHKQAAHLRLPVHTNSSGKLSGQSFIFFVISHFAFQVSPSKFDMSRLAT